MTAQKVRQSLRLASGCEGLIQQGPDRRQYIVIDHSGLSLHRVPGMASAITGDTMNKRPSFSPRF
jgi:hypothetical protein